MFSLLTPSGPIWLGVVAGLGALVGALLRRHVLSGAHRRPGDPEPPADDAGRNVDRPVREAVGSWAGSSVRDPRWLPVGLALGWFGVALALAARPPAVIAAYLAALTVGAWLMAVDADVQRLPNAVTLPAVPLSAAALAGCSALARDPPAWGRSLLGAVVLGSVYLLLYVIGARRGAAGIGLGDVKLALSLGQWLGWLGWPVLVAGAYLGFVLSGVWALCLLANRRARLGTALPHGPAMVAGAWLGSCATPFL